MPLFAQAGFAPIHPNRYPHHMAPGFGGITEATNAANLESARAMRAGEDNVISTAMTASLAQNRELKAQTDWRIAHVHSR